jgi:hypothetical protein
MWQGMYRRADSPFLWFRYKGAAGGLSSSFPQETGRTPDEIKAVWACKAVARKSGL